MTRKEVTEIVMNYPTSNELGFTAVEQVLLIMEFEDFNIQKYYNAFFGCTRALVGKITITYHSDIITAIMCGLENRDIQSHEWD